MYSFSSVLDELRFPGWVCFGWERSCGMRGGRGEDFGGKNQPFEGAVTAGPAFRDSIVEFFCRWRRSMRRSGRLWGLRGGWKRRRAAPRHLDRGLGGRGPGDGLVPGCAGLCISSGFSSSTNSSSAHGSSSAGDGAWTQGRAKGQLAHSIIHNAWDAVTYHVFVRTTETPGR